MRELAKRRLLEILDLAERHRAEYPLQIPEGANDDGFYFARCAGAAEGKLNNAAALAEMALRLLDSVEEE